MFTTIKNCVKNTTDTVTGQAKLKKIEMDQKITAMKITNCARRELRKVK